MEPKSTPFRNSVTGAIIIAATFSLANHAQAASGSWNVNPVAVPGTTAGDVVGLTFDTNTTGKTVTIDTANLAMVSFKEILDGLILPRQGVLSPWIVISKP